jgi:hypothetical protein
LKFAHVQDENWTTIRKQKLFYTSVAWINRMIDIILLLEILNTQSVIF